MSYGDPYYAVSIMGEGEGFLNIQPPLNVLNCESLLARFMGKDTESTELLIAIHDSLALGGRSILT